MAGQYALDGDGNLIRGEALTFAYSGAGVATLIDKVGTGFKVHVGTRNLAGIVTTLDDGGKNKDGKGYLVLENDAAPTTAVNADLYDDFTKRELKALCREREIEFKGNPNNVTLIGLLTAADATTSDEQGEG